MFNENISLWLQQNKKIEPKENIPGRLGHQTEKKMQFQCPNTARKQGIPVRLANQFITKYKWHIYRRQAHSC